MAPLMVTLSEAIERAHSEDRSVLTEIESKQVLAAAGIPVAEATLATSADNAANAAAKAGFPVVLKIVSPDVTHKSDVGGVKIGLEDEAAVRTAYDDIVTAVKDRQPKARIEGVAVQAMARPGTEVIVGMSKDPQFGPVLMFGLGGIFVEALRDVSFRVAPLTRLDAEAMIDEIRGRRVLEGLRGQPPVDRDALVDAILKVSDLASACREEIEELDINPLVVFPQGARAVDALITRGPAKLS